MPKMGGCNSDMPKAQIGFKGKRMNPTDFARNNLAKGGVNNLMKGKADKAAIKAGGAHQGKHTHMPDGY